MVVFIFTCKLIEVFISLYLNVGLWLFIVIIELFTYAILYRRFYIKRNTGYLFLVTNFEAMNDFPSKIFTRNCSTYAFILSNSDKNTLDPPPSRWM